VKTDASSTVLVELKESSGTTLLADQLGYFQQGRATLSDLAVASAGGSTIPLKVSTPGIEGITPVYVKVKLDAECPPGYSQTKTTQGNDACAACKELTYEHGGQCHACKAGMACSKKGLSFKNVRLEPGFWRTGQESEDVRVCRFSEASCPGHTINNVSYCASGYVGPLCSECDVGYFMSWAGNVLCKACGQSANHTPLIILGVIVGVCIGVIVGVRHLKSAKAHLLPQRETITRESTTSDGPQPKDKLPSQGDATAFNDEPIAQKDEPPKSAGKHKTDKDKLSLAEILYTKGQTNAMSLFSMFQILSQFTAILGSTRDSGGGGVIPEPAATLARGLGVANFDVLSYMPVGCQSMGLGNFYTQLFIKTLGPLVVVAFLWVPALGLRVTGRSYFRAKSIASDFSLMWLELLLPNVSTAVFQTLICGAFS
jgi:hypothetical protein